VARKGKIAETEDFIPTIRITAGDMTRVVDEVGVALRARPYDLYQRGGQIVHPVQTPAAASDGRETSIHRIVLVEVPYLAEVITRAARLEKFDARKQDFVTTNCPALVAETLRARGQFDQLRVLNRVINAPTLRSDGSILQAPGYDRETGLLFDPGERAFPQIADRPSRDDARAALRLLKDDLLSGFPFVTPVDRAVALSGLITPLVRASLSAAPLHGNTSPASGSGKSLLVDLAALVSTGRLAAVISQGESEQEFEKRLGASLLAGDGMVSIDNCEAPLGGSLLCQALTQSVLRIRVLGLSLNVDAPSNAAIFATGNNLVLSGDLTRRALLCSIDPQIERPELRIFDADPVAMVHADRGRYVAAGLTMLRAYAIADWADAPAPVGSFVEWCRMVRDALIWLGEADPCESMVKTRAADPRLLELKAVMDQWEAVIGEGARKSAAAIIETASDCAQSFDGMGSLLFPDFHDALVTVAGGQGAKINTRRLGRWLGRNKERVVAGRRIVENGTHAGAPSRRLPARGAPARSPFF
jgi:putative DNA primase/helicase